MRYLSFVLLFFVMQSCGDNASISIVEIELKEVKDLSIRAIDIEDSLIVMSGSNSSFIYSQDLGKNWHFKSIDTNRREYRSICIGKKGIFVANIASPTQILKTENLGISWDTVYSNTHPNSFINTLKSIDNYVVASGDPTNYKSLNILISDDYGSNWKELDGAILPAVADGEAQFAASNTCVEAVESNIWIASGGKKASIIVSSDFGKTWNKQNIDFVEGMQMTGIYSLDFYDSQIGFAFGGDWNQVDMYNHNKFYTRDGGRTWHESKSTGVGYHSCVQYLDREHLLAVGKEGISFSDDGGKNWKTISKEKGYYSFRKIDQNRIIMSGAGKIAIAEVKY